MTVGINDIQKRLERYEDKLDFPLKDVGKILKILTTAMQGVTSSEWRKKCTVGEEGRTTGISNRYFYAARFCMENWGWVEKPKRGEKVEVTEKGRNMVFLLGRPQYNEIEFKVDRGEKPGKIKLCFESKSLDDVTKLRRLLLPFLRNYSFQQFIAQNLPSSSTGREFSGSLKISYDVRENKDVIQLFRHMLDFYVEICKPPEEEAERILSFGFITPYMFDDLRSGHWSWNYYNYWDKREKEAIDEKNKKWQETFEKMKSRDGRELRDWELVDAFYKKWKRRPEAKIDIEKYVPKWLIEAIKKPVVRKWIIRRLDENIDFFMPSFFWEELGFRRIIEKRIPSEYLIIKEFPAYYSYWSHPYDTRLVRPEFGEFLPEIEIRFVMARAFHKIDEKRAFSEIYYGIRDYYKKRGFYQAWLLLREVRNLNLRIFRPIDEAMIRWASNTPVRLDDIYFALCKGELSLPESIKAIRKGDYDFEKRKRR